MKNLVIDEEDVETDTAAVRKSTDLQSSLSGKPDAMASFYGIQLPKH